MFGRHAETGIVRWDPVVAEKLIGGLHRCNPVKPELLRQASLPGSEYPLTTPPRLRRVGQDQLDPKLLERSRDLRPCPSDRTFHLLQTPDISCASATAKIFIVND